MSYNSDLPKGTDVVYTFSGASFSTKLLVIESGRWMSELGKDGLADRVPRHRRPHHVNCMGEHGTRNASVHLLVRHLCVKRERATAVFAGAKSLMEQVHERTVLAGQARPLVIVTGRVGKVQDSACSAME
jgi:hypothetical protein